MKRIQNIDIARGLVILIMALDHCRDLLHTTAITQNPTDLNTTTPILFFTRWITHFCAPAFVFLAGSSAYLSFKKSKNRSVARNFLIKRGLWLVLLEFTVINFGLWFDIHFQMLFFQVIAAIGFGMIILATILSISPKTITAIGIGIISIHNLLEWLFQGSQSIWIKIASPFFVPSMFPLSEHLTFFIGYPLIPWLGILLLGFGLGRIFEMETATRKKRFLQYGLISLIGFLVIRFINIYGDPSPWAKQESFVKTVLSFLNTSKYPPSLLYSLMTLSGLFFLLSFTEGIQNTASQFLSIYGKVPLFFYLIHWYIIHPIMFGMLFSQGYHWKDLPFGNFQFGRPATESGWPLGIVYLVWILVILLMYPLCKWYSNYKMNHPEKTYLRFL